MRKHIVTIHPHQRVVVKIIHKLQDALFTLGYKLCVGCFVGGKSEQQYEQRNHKFFSSPVRRCIPSAPSLINIILGVWYVDAMNSMILSNDVTYSLFGVNGCTLNTGLNSYN